MAARPATSSSRVGRICAHVSAGPHSSVPAAAAAAAAAAADDPAAVLSAEQLASFRADGFLLLKGLVPPTELAAVEADSRALIERGQAGPFGDARWSYGAV